MSKLVLALLFIGLGTVLVPGAVQAQSADDVCKGVGTATGGFGCSAPSESVTVNNVIGTAINILSAVVGVVAVIMIVIGGFKYVTSGGDASSVSSAKQTIIYAIIGLVVAAAARIIATFVLSRVTGNAPPPTP